MGFSLDSLSNSFMGGKMSKLTEEARHMLYPNKKVTIEKKNSSAEAFKQYLVDKGIETFDMYDILNYLAHCFHTNQKFRYGEAKSHILTTIEATTGKKFVEDLLMVKSARSARLERPQQAKYDDTWDMNLMWK